MSKQPAPAVDSRARPAPAPVLATEAIEDERLAAVRRYDIVDTPPDGAFDRITALAARLFNVPIAIVSIVDEDRIWFKSHHGLEIDETSRDPGLCASAIMQTDPWLVSDARADPRTMANPLVAGEVGLRFYAGVPLADEEGHGLGTLCIIDRAPRTLTPDEVATLQDLAAVVMDEIELRLASRRLSEQEWALADEQRRLAEDIIQVTAYIRGLSDTEDADAVRAAICRIAMDIVQADSAAIHELAGDDLTLTQTLNVGAPWTSPDTYLQDLSSPAARAFIRGKAVQVTQTESSAPETFWQPFAAGGRTSVAVLALAWDRPSDMSPIRLSHLMAHVAAEAMAAFERADLLTQLEALARTDALTGLPNRRAINEDLPRELERARREGRSLCVAILDIDHFKRFNDTYGHPAGDRLLADAAVTWRDALRGGTDLLARYGGEEFLVVLPASTTDAHATMERLRASTPEGQTASVGLAIWDPAESADELVARADLALYAAKRAGRNRIEQAPVRSGPG